MAFSIMKRRAAHDAGLTKFYTGRPCIHGHDAQRWVVTGACVACARNAQREYAATMRGNRASALVKVRVHPEDAEAIRHTATMLNALRDVKAAAAEEAQPVRSLFATELAMLPEGHQTPAFQPHPGTKK